MEGARERARARDAEVFEFVGVECVAHAAFVSRVGAALEDKRSWCGLIVDGHHVHPASLRVAIAAKPHGKCVLVTDAMPPVGGRETSFLLQGRKIMIEGKRCASEDGHQQRRDDPDGQQH